MHDRSIVIYPYRILATLLWLIGLGLIVSAFFTGILPAGHLGLACIILGCMSRVHCYFAQMDHREETAFTLGQDSVRKIR